MMADSTTRVRPKASAVVSTPAATLAPVPWKPKLTVATPQPTNTSSAVPTNSAAALRGRAGSSVTVLPACGPTAPAEDLTAILPPISASSTDFAGGYPHYPYPQSHSA